jgi:hypothetical protein
MASGGSNREADKLTCVFIWAFCERRRVPEGAPVLARIPKVLSCRGEGPINSREIVVLRNAVAHVISSDFIT